MWLNYLRKDFKQSKGSSILLVGLVALATTAVLTAIILGWQLNQSIQHLTTRAQTPDYLVMHSGSLNSKRLTQFATQHPAVKKYQVIQFLNIESSDVAIKGEDLTGNVQDNGFVTQSKEFDFLLDLDNQVIQPKAGQVYLPLIYYQEDLQKGDTISVAGYPLRFAGYFRDSQMNSALSSSKRWLISKEDYQHIQAKGKLEYLIEFQLKPDVNFTQFGVDYAAAGLEANGPTITRPLFRLINALSDGAVIFIILLVGCFILSMVHMALRFTLKTQLELDYHAIGVMKAIGFRSSDLRTLYLGKYCLISLVGSFLGGVLTFQLLPVLQGNIEKFMGLVPLNVTGWLILLAVFLVLNGLVLLWVVRLLSAFKHISSSQALKGIVGNIKSVKASRLASRLMRKGWVNHALVAQETMTKKRVYGVVIWMLLLSVMTVAIPTLLSKTLEDPSIKNYMGIGNYDVMINIQQTDDIETKVRRIQQDLKARPQVAKTHVLLNKKIKLKNQQGILFAQIGNHQLFPIHPSKGRLPKATEEVCLSQLLADELGMQVGSILEVEANGQAIPLKVVGLYGDITNGGKVVKMVLDDQTSPIMSAGIGFTFKETNPVKRQEVIKNLAQNYPFAKVNDTKAFMNQTYGSTIQLINQAKTFCALIASLLVILSISLFMFYLNAHNRYQNTVMRVLGFRKSDLYRQNGYRLLSLIVIALPLGLALSVYGGQGVLGLIMSQLGGSGFQFKGDLFFLWGELPIWLGLLTGFCGYVWTRISLKQLSLEGLKEE